MSDIVERLRNAQNWMREESGSWGFTTHVCDHAPFEAADEIEKLRAALQSVLNACDQGRMIERGAGGMTIDAQISRSFYYGVPAWPIEEARAALGEKE